MATKGGEEVGGDVGSVEAAAVAVAAAAASLPSGGKHHHMCFTLKHTSTTAKSLAVGIVSGEATFLWAVTPSTLVLLSQAAPPLKLRDYFSSIS